ncbi:MAG: serine/threonine protein phosphatase [Myxococcota bacterium]
MRRIAAGLVVLGMLGVLGGSGGLGCAGLGPGGERGAGDRFTIAMIPDTQNYTDYTHQKAEGFAIDAAALYLEQLGWVAENARSRGGDIVFVASVGDTWQHPSKWMDPAHEAIGHARVANPYFDAHFTPSEKVARIEIPTAIAGYRLIADAGLPFGIPPGNHDYDAMYNVASHPPDLSKPPQAITFTVEDLGLLHVGGLEGFVGAFGADSDFFSGKPWYVAAYGGGTSSAQVFEAGGYRFLHLAIEMQAGDDVLAWARDVIAAHPGLPTIVSTHDYLSPKATRIEGGFLDFTLAHAEHNTPQQMFEKLIAVESQIFLVLCGHYHGQAYLREDDAAGFEVHTVLADYQDRGQVGLDAGQPRDPLRGGPVGIGDGWLRLLEFDTTTDPPTIAMRTYSTHYGKHASEMPDYVAWYRDHEQAGMSDAAFLAAEEYEIVLTDFTERFGAPSP